MKEKQHPAVFGEEKNNFMTNTPHFNAVVESFLTEAKKYSKKKPVKAVKKKHQKKSK